MDSITQIALGAAVGEAAIGKKVGNRALLWGAIAATIPDLDIVAYPILDEFSKLSWHRGYSHSIIFAVLFAPLLGWFIWKLYKEKQGSWRDWTRLSFLALFTHSLLDCFTTYGTQWFLPFSNYRVAFNTIFVVDPLYTLPLLIPLVVLMFYKGTVRKRRVLNYLGLGLSTAYLLFTVVNKAHINAVFEQALTQQNVRYEQYMSTPTPLNNILWRALVKGTDGYWVGYYSLLDRNKSIHFSYLPRNEHLLSEVPDKKVIAKLKWFSKGYYALKQTESGILFNDLRLGEFSSPAAGNGLSVGNFGLDHPADFQYIFSFHLENGKGPQSPTVAITRIRPSIAGAGVVLGQLWQRIKGI